MTTLTSICSARTTCPKPRAYCSHSSIRKGVYEGDTCPVCGAYAAIDIYKEQKLDSSISDNRLHGLFFTKVPEAYKSLNLSVWNSLADSAWRTGTPIERAYLIFFMAFAEASGKASVSESEYWADTLETEAKIRAYLIDHDVHIKKDMDFVIASIADGLETRRNIRTLQANFGIAMAGGLFESHSRSECEIKYQRATIITERVTALGCSERDDLPYFNATRYLAEAAD